MDHEEISRMLDLIKQGQKRKGLTKQLADALSVMVEREILKDLSFKYAQIDKYTEEHNE